MKLTKNKLLRSAGRQMRQSPVIVVLIAIELLGMVLVQAARAQALSTTTVQGTVYLANGHAGSGTLRVSWPTFTTANGQAVIADSTTVTIGPDGFVNVNLAPNLGATPAGLFYTAVFYLSDGTTSTQYWVVPSAAQASLAQVQSQVMPAAQAVQAVNKAYVDQSIAALSQSQLTASGGTLSGPLYLSADPTQAMQAADKHYVDAAVSQSVPITGGATTGALTALQLGAAYQVDQFPGADFGAKLQACLSTVSAAYGGTCDARNFSGMLAMGSNLTISSANATIELPCATIATANQVIVTAGTRNVALRGCALRGGSAASGNQGGTVFAYSGSSAMVQVGDPTYATDTQGFHMDDVVINTIAATSATAHGLVAYRTQEMDLESLYFLGNPNQTGMTLDGTGNYTGGTFYDDAFNGFQTAVNAIGHQASNLATTDWTNASTFVRLHINCPTSSGNPIAGTFGINLQQGDGNTFTGGDVEGCSTALHLGANAQNNTIVGLRNENSSSQVVADAGSSYNNWMTGGTMFTGKLTDNGTRNSFLDTFHRSFNGMNGDWYGSQQDATVTNHYRIGTGTGNERGLLNRFQTDYGYRWTTGLSDATGGEQFYQILDELNNVYRLSIGQYNNGQSSANNQTVINAAGTGAVVLNGSNNAGTGGVVIGSGGAGAVAVATINSAGNAQFNGALQVGGASTFAGSTTVRNQADAEIDQVLWAGATASQKESLTYKDWNGNSQWYAMKDASNNWALNSAMGGLDSFKAYQSTNSGDTYVNASNAAGVVRVNYETGAGTAFKIYGGGTSSLYASFTGASSIQFPGLAAGSGHNCLQIDNSGYLSNTGSACGSGSGGSGTVNTANSGQIAYYTVNGTSIGGMNTVPLASGGTGSATAEGALQNLGGISSTSTSQQTMAGPISAPYTNGVINAALQTGADGGAKLAAAITAACAAGVRAVDARGFGAGNQAVSSTVGLGCSDGAPLEIIFDQSTKWIPSTNTTDLFWLEPGANAKNVAVDVSTVSGYSGNGMKLCCTTYGNQPANSAGGARTELNGYIFNNGSNATGTALLLSSTSTSQWIQFADIANVNISGGLNGVLLTASNSGWVNGNTFHNVKETNAVHGFKGITASGGSVVGNRVDSYQAEIGSNVLDYLWITGTGSCYGNQFNNTFLWDMNTPTSSQHTVLIDANCSQNHVDGFLGSYAGSPYPWIVTDVSSNNYIFDTESGYTWGQPTFKNVVNALRFNATDLTAFQIQGHSFLTSDGGSTFLQSIGSSPADVCFGSEYGGTYWCRDGSGNLKNNNGTILPAGLTGYYGTSGTKVQLSDGTGMSGNLTKFASDGSVMNGPQPPVGAVVGTTDTQTLTNKSIAGSEINSGVVSPTYGGTGQNESSATGVGQFSSGTYSVSTGLANGTAATTQSAGDNSTKVATTAYVASPGAITPTTVTASGIIAGGNDTTRTTSTTIGTTGFTTTGLVLPAVPANTTKNGRCIILWQMSSASYAATFGIGMSNAPTGLWGGSSVTYAAAGTSNWLAFAQTATSATAISSATTAGASGTTYRAEIDFTLQSGAASPVAVTLYGEVSNASATLTIQPGSACYWLP